MMSSRPNDSFLERGGMWVVSQGLLLLGVLVLSLVYPGHHQQVVPRMLGITLIVMGGCLWFAGARALRKNLTPYPKPSFNAKLTRDGIYAHLRHPLYTSVVLVFLGWALFRGSGPALLIAFLLIPFFAAKANREEHWLRQQFPDYVQYAKQTRRFIPWIY